MLCAQTYINKEWTQSTGQPDNITWQASTIDPFGDLIVVGNTQLAPGNSNVLVTKYNSIGELLWQQTYDGTAGANDYGVAVVTNSTGDVFVAATVHQTGNDLDFALLKYSSIGSLVWDATWNGPSDLADVPAGLFLDSLGNIYMHGASWAGPIFADHAFVKFSGAGAVVWHSMYDHAGLHDAAVGAEIVDGMLFSFGASATAMGEWAVALLTHDLATGTILDTLVSPLPGVGLHEASAWSMDQSGNFYVTGTYHDGIQNVIQTLKIGAGFGIQWLENFDGDGLGAIGAAVAADEAGNVYVGGASYNELGGLEFITLKYDPYGELLWSRLHKPHSGQHTALVTKLAVHESGIIVAGTAFDGSSLSFATLMYNENGKLLWSEEHGSEQTSDKAMALALGQQGVIYVSGITGDITDEWTYTTVKYDVYHKDNPAVLDSLGNPLYMANEVIVKFRPHLVDPAVVDSKDWQHGALRDIVPDSVQFAMEEKFGLSPGYLSRMKVVKVFRQLTRADSISISRLGEEVEIPKFWSTFLLSNEGIGENVRTIADSLNTMWALFEYAEPNHLFQLYSNDPLYQDNLQGSLSPIPGYPNASINIEPAWAIQTGRPDIRVGIIDTPVKWDHEDFLTNGISKVVNGFDFNLNSAIVPTGPSYENVYSGHGFHGTACAGIIGALRNNNLGIAGIAGGDVDGDGNTGTAIVPLGVSDGGSGYIDLCVMAPAIVSGATDLQDDPLGFGCHVLSMSLGRPGTFQNSCPSLMNAVRYAYRNHCLVVAAAGNTADSANSFINWPTSYPFYGFTEEAALISVGATGNNGQFLQPGNGAIGYSNYGQGLDLVAPGSPTLISSLGGLPAGSWCPNGYLGPYHCFEGTSAATPHVAGVAALMIAEHSVLNGAPNGLAPEDVKNILQESALLLPSPYDSLEIPEYNDWHGHGRLDAGAALNAVSSPNCVLHFTPWLGLFAADTLAQEVIQLSEPNAWNLPAGGYNAIRVEVYQQFAHELPLTAEVIGHWGRESSSVGASTSPARGLTEANYIFDVTDNNVVVTTTTNSWYILNSIDNSVIVNDWYPAQPDQLRTAYSLHVRNADCWGISTVSVDEVDAPDAFSVYPNPTNDMVHIALGKTMGEGWEMTLTDALGRLMHSEVTGQGRPLSIQVSNLPSGTYCIVLRKGAAIYARRFIKIS